MKHQAVISYMTLWIVQKRGDCLQASCSGSRGMSSCFAWHSAQTTPAAGLPIKHFTNADGQGFSVLRATVAYQTSKDATRGEHGRFEEIPTGHVQAHLPPAIRVALDVGEVPHRLLPKALLLVKAVAAPECSIHLGPAVLQPLGQGDRLRGGLSLDHGRLFRRKAGTGTDMGCSSWACGGCSGLGQSTGCRM